MTAAAQLRISILGPPVISTGDETLTLGRLQHRALLYRLAAQADPVPRDHLAFLFWPDVSDAKSRRHLTQLLSRVRRLLPDPDLIIASKEHLQLDPVRVQSDAVDFERLCQLGDDTRALAQAVSLYSDTLLAGVSLSANPEYEVWLVGERYRFEKRLLDACDRLIEAHMKQGRHAEAAALAQRYLAVDELAEDVHRRLMEAYAAAGDRAAALHQYERCVEVLERELGVAPLPETEEAYRTVLGGEVAIEPAPYRPAWPTLSGPDVPLVGRNDLLQELRTAFRHVQEGQRKVVLLRGEAGIGKSRLMQEFATAVQEEALVLASACHASTQSIPYQPMVEALRPLLRRPSLIRSVPSTWLSEASVLLPELLELSPGLAPPQESADPQQARGKLFEALHQIVLGLDSASTPVLLCLDDLHWADATTLEWLGYLARQTKRRSLMLIGTFRDEEADAVTSLKRELARMGIRAECRLTGLERGAVGQIMSHLKMVDAPAMKARLHVLTGGNPFFLLETMHELLESGLDTITMAEGRNLPISQNARETIRRRLGHLLPLSRQILETGAVQGTVFGFDFIGRAAGRSQIETADALDELVNRTLLIEEEDGFRFYHDLIRVAVYQDLSPWRRRLLHQRVAQTLEAKHAGQTEAMAVQLGRHFEAAGQTDKAIFYWQQVGNAASRLYAHAEAITSFGRALELAKEGAGHEQLQPLFVSLGRSLELDSQFDVAFNTYMEMESMGIEIHSRPTELAALMAQATLCTTYNPQQDLARGEAVSRRALDLAKQIGDEAAEAKILGNLIVLYSYAQRWQESIESGKRSIEIARRANLPGQLALSLTELGGHCYEVRGQLAAAKEALDEALTLWRKQNNLNMLADSLATIAAIGVWEGDYDGAIRNGQESLRINRQIDSLWGQSYSLYKLGWVHWDRCRPDLALETMEESLRLAQQSGFGVPKAVTQADVAMVYAELGDNAQAVDAARLALTSAETQGLLFLNYALGALAQVRIRQGRLGQAQTLLARADVESDPLALPIYDAPALVARAMLALQQEDYARTVEEAKRLGRHSASAHRPTALLIEAQGLLALGERDAAYARLVEAQDEAERIGSHRTLWRILHLLGEIESAHTVPFGVSYTCLAKSRRMARKRNICVAMRGRS